MASSEAGVSYPELLYVRRRFLQKDALRDAIRRVVNATLTARLPEIWGEVTTACASDAKHYGVWDQNLMTEYHARYRKAGVTIYWHTDKRAACGRGGRSAWKSSCARRGPMAFCSCPNGGSSNGPSDGLAVIAAYPRIMSI
jgi:Tn3 transposase DDE domain